MSEWGAAFWLREEGDELVASGSATGVLLRLGRMIERVGAVIERFQSMEVGARYFSMVECSSCPGPAERRVREWEANSGMLGDWLYKERMIEKRERGRRRRSKDEAKNLVKI